MARDRQPRRGGRPPKPLDSAHLRALALHYVGRYATSSGKLALYLDRKVRERGWDADVPADVSGLVREFAERGYIDDAGFAAARRETLLRRGMGSRRIGLALHQSGVGQALAQSQSVLAEEEALAAAIDFARRKRLGPYAVRTEDDKARRRAFAAMARAGHDYGIISQILRAGPPPDADQ